MSNEELNRKLAELLGWKKKRANVGRQRPPEYFWREPVSQIYTDLPNYAGDLNAAHGVVMGLNEDQRSEYRHALVTQWPSHKVDAVDASAKERSEALIKTLEEKQ